MCIIQRDSGNTCSRYPKPLNSISEVCRWGTGTHFGWSLQLLVFHSQLVSKLKPPWIGSPDCSGEFNQQYRIWLWLTLPCVMEQLHCDVSESCCAVEWSQTERNVACGNSVEWTHTNVNTYLIYKRVNTYGKYNKNNGLMLPHIYKCHSKFFW